MDQARALVAALQAELRAAGEQKLPLAARVSGRLEADPFIQQHPEVPGAGAERRVLRIS